MFDEGEVCWLRSRLITDKVTFAYLADVFVFGISQRVSQAKWLVKPQLITLTSIRIK